MIHQGYCRFNWIVRYNLNDILVFVFRRFSPELLGVQASSALVWLIMEVLAMLLSLYLVTVNTDLTTIDLLAFSGYKYVGYVQGSCWNPEVFIYLFKNFISVFHRMIVGVVAGLLFGRPAYYLSLLWCCAAIFVFMVSKNCPCSISHPDRNHTCTNYNVQNCTSWG